MAGLLPVETFKRWGLKGGMAILDQGIFSGSNFILNILLARWLLPEEYGAYAVGLSVSVLFLQLLMSYIMEPMGVLGPSHFGSNLKSYLLAQLRLYLVAIIAIGLLFAAAAYVYGRLESRSLVGPVLTALGLLLAVILLPWIMRRVFYVLQRPAVAVLGSIIYALSLISSVLVMRQQNVLSGLTSVFTVALAGLCSGFFLFTQLSPRQTSAGGISLDTLHRGNWTFGRWLVLSSILVVIAAQSQIYIAGSVLGLQASGVLYALQTLSQPMTLTVTAITALMTPSLAADYARGDIRSFKRKAFSMTFALTGLALLFELFLIWFNLPLEQIVYGGRFSAEAGLIPIWGLSPLITSLVSGMQSSLQAAKYSYSLLIASIFWLPASLGSCLLLIDGWGLEGVAWSTVLGYVVMALVITFLYWVWLRGNAPVTVQI